MKLINERNQLNRSTRYVVNSDLKQYDKWINTYNKAISSPNTDIYDIFKSYQQYLQSINTPKSSIARKLSNIKNFHVDFVNFVKRKRLTSITSKNKEILDSEVLTQKKSSFVTPQVINNNIPITNINVTEKYNAQSIFGKNNINKKIIYFLSITLFLAILFSYFYFSGKDSTTKVSVNPLLELANSNPSLLNKQKIILSLSVKNNLKKDETVKVIYLTIYNSRTSRSPISKSSCSFNVTNANDEDILMVDLNKYCSKSFLSNFSVNNFLGIRVNSNPESYPRLSIGDLLNPSFYSYFDDSNTNSDDTQNNIVKSLRSKLLSSFNDKVKITPIFDQLSPTSIASQSATISASLIVLTLTPSPTP